MSSTISIELLGRRKTVTRLNAQHQLGKLSPAVRPPTPIFMICVINLLEHARKIFRVAVQEVFHNVVMSSVGSTERPLND